jgi:hypothetical protein
VKIFSIRPVRGTRHAGKHQPKITPCVRVIGALFIALAAVTAVNTCPASTVQSIDFDDLDIRAQSDSFSYRGAESVIMPGNRYLSQGVQFTTGAIDTDTFAVGDVLTFAKWKDQVLLSRFDSFANSQPNVLFPGPVSNFDPIPGESIRSLLGFLPTSRQVYFDILLTFSVPVTHVEIMSDMALFDPPDPLRLVALKPDAMLSQYHVLGYDEKYDDAVAPPTNLLSIDLGGKSFSYALVEVVSEAEAFDNLRFTQVPEPRSLLLACLGTLAMATSAARFARPRG